MTTKSVESICVQGYGNWSSDSCFFKAIQALKIGESENKIIKIFKRSSVKEIQETEDTTKKTLLYLAIEKNYLLLIQKLISLGVDVNANIKNPVEYSPLYTAAKKGRVEIIKLFLQSGAKINERSKDGKTPLFVACLEGNLEAVKALLNYQGKEKAQIENTGPNGSSALHVAAYKGHARMISLLLESGAKINERLEDTSTPLSIARKRGNLEALMTLLNYQGEERAEFENTGADGWSVLHAAVVEGHPKIIEFLLQSGAKINERSKDGKTPLFLACLEGNLEAVKALLNYQGEEKVQIENTGFKGWSALHVAAYRGYAKIIEFLLQSGAKINERSKDGKTPLFVACQKGDLETVKALLNYQGKEKAEIENTGPNGWSALHVAANNNSAKIIELLLSSGAKINEKSQDEKNPFSIAREKRNLEAVKALLSYQGEEEVEIENTGLDKRSKLYEAAVKGHLDIIEFFLDMELR